MRLIQDLVVSSDDVLSKIQHALTVLNRSEVDSTWVRSNEWKLMIKRIQDEDISSLKRCFKYSEIGYIDYHKWQTLLKKSQFYVSLALHDYYLYQQMTFKVDSVWNDAHLVVIMKDLKHTFQEIQLYVSYMLLKSSVCVCKDISSECINYLVKLFRTRINYLASRQIAFIESILIHISTPCVMSELEIPICLLSDTRAAIDSAICGFYTAVNQPSSSNSKPLELIEFISLAIYIVVGRGLRTSWIDGVSVEFWDCIMDSMLHLLYREDSLMDRWKEQVEILHDELSFFKYFLLDHPDECTGIGDWNLLLPRVKLEMCKNIAYLLYSFYHNSFTKESIGGIKETTKRIKSRLTDYWQIPKSLHSGHPAYDEFLFLDPFMENMNIMISSESDSAPFYQMKNVLKELASLVDSFGKTFGQQTVLEDLWRQIQEVAYEMEGILESLVVLRIPVWRGMLWFLEVEEHISVIERKVSKICNEGYNIQDHNASQRSNYISIAEEEVVGFEDEEISVVNKLIGGSKGMEVISIVGMPGLGKTTLARKVFSSYTISDQFNIRSWCSVSQAYRKKDLLVQILEHIILFDKKYSNRDEDELAEILYKELKKQKYFIIMDDVWDNGAWDQIRRSFPDDGNGSRVLLTSRFNHLNLQPESKIHPLKHLSDDESWELLQKKLFRRENCPLQNLEIGRRIARDCKGLPLAVVVVAGLLLDVNQDNWEKVASGVFSFIVNDYPSQCAGLLEMSYNNLPYYLRPCFLYLGVFPPDTEISVQKLIQLWIAEGFIRTTGAKSMDCVAENFLMDLIRRNLMQVSQRTPLGCVKTCHVHDLIHGFCLAKSKDTSFLQVDVGSAAEGFTCRRLSIYSDMCHFSEKLSSCQSASSLLIFSSFNMDSAFYIFYKFKYLTVIDLMSPSISDSIDLPDSIGLLLHLRYLAGKFSSVPSSIGNLASLITLVMVAFTDKIQLPLSFYNLAKLQHLDMNCATIFKKTSSNNDFHFYNLQTLSTLLVPASDSTILTRFPNLRKLKCIIPNIEQDNSSSYLFCPLPGLELLNQLEHLDVTYLLGDWNELCPLPIHWGFNFPTSLKTLSLKMLCISWENMSLNLRQLANLEVLKLDCSAFVGEQWQTEDGMFDKLKYLRLRGLNIRVWNASSDHFPLLEQLVVQGCQHLEEVPACFSDVFTLKMIEVSGCKLSVEESVKQIQEEQLEYGNEQLKILARDNGQNKENIWRWTVRRKLHTED